MPKSLVEQMEEVMSKLSKANEVSNKKDILKYVKNNNHIKLSEYAIDNLLNFKKKPWEKFVNSSNEDLICS